MTNKATSSTKPNIIFSNNDIHLDYADDDIKHLTQSRKLKETLGLDIFIILISEGIRCIAITLEITILVQTSGMFIWQDEKQREEDEIASISCHSCDIDLNEPQICGLNQIR